MPALSNPRHERFVQELVKGRPAEAAYRLAGYKFQKGHASRLQRRPAIAQRYDELMASAARDSEVTAAAIMNELAAIAFADIADYVTIDADGMPRPDLSRMTRQQAAALAEVSVESDKTRRRTRIKLGDKLGALVNLARMLGLYREQVAAPEPPPPTEKPSEIEVAHRIASILRRSNIRIVPMDNSGQTQKSVPE